MRDSPASIANAIKPDWRKQLPVLVRIDSKPEKAWRINMMPAGDGSFYLYLHGTVRRASQVKVGDRVKVEVEFDARYRKDPLRPGPKWFEAALAGNPTGALNWKALTPSRKKEILRYLANLTSAEARDRNLDKVMSVAASAAESCTRIERAYEQRHGKSSM